MIKLILPILILILVCLLTSVQPANWKEYGFDHAHDGFNSDEFILTSDSLTFNNLANRWSVALEGVVLSQVLYMENVNIYGASTNVVFVSTEGGIIYAINADSGSVIWSDDLGSTVDNNCSIYPNGQFGVSSTSYIDTKTAIVYAMSGSGSLYCFHLATGEHCHPQSAWPISAYDPSIYHTFGGLTYLHNYIYITVAGHCDSSITKVMIYRFNIESPWDPPLKSESMTTSVNGLHGYGGMSYNSVSNRLYAAVGGSENGIVAFDPTTLEIIGNFAPSEYSDYGGSTIFISPSNGCPAFTATENRAGFLTRTDTMGNYIDKWQYASSSDDNFAANPAFDRVRNMLYVSNSNPHSPYGAGLIALLVTNDCGLEVMWNVKLKSSGRVWMSHWPAPVVAGGVVYVATGANGQLFAVNADSGVVLWVSTQALGYLMSPPIVVNGMLLIADSGKRFDGVTSKLWAFTRLFDSEAQLNGDPTLEPTMEPSLQATFSPTLSSSTINTSGEPTVEPSTQPTNAPTVVPTTIPTLRPSTEPTNGPSESPSVEPSTSPTAFPTIHPTATPSLLPSALPSTNPTIEPSLTPSVIPTSIPTVNPTLFPSESPTTESSSNPTTVPSSIPTMSPTTATVTPSTLPSISPSLRPSSQPSLQPTSVPTQRTMAPTLAPSLKPTPTMTPTSSPTQTPSSAPTKSPTPTPTNAPSLPMPTQLLRTQVNFTAEITLQDFDLDNLSAGESLADDIEDSIIYVLSLLLSIAEKSIKVLDIVPVGSRRTTSAGVSEAKVLGSVEVSVEIAVIAEKLGFKSSKAADVQQSLSSVIVGAAASGSLATDLGRKNSVFDGVSVVNVMVSTPIVNTVYAEPTLSPVANPSVAPICLRIAVEDGFGDGWGTGQLIVYPTWTSPVTISPECGELNRKIGRFCFPNSASLEDQFVVVRIVGFRVLRGWEVFWQVTNENNGNIYSGSSDTSMKFSLQASTSSDVRARRVVLTSSSNLLEEVECYSCAEDLSDDAYRGNGGESVESVTGNTGVEFKHGDNNPWTAIRVHSSSGNNPPVMKQLGSLFDEKPVHVSKGYAIKVHRSHSETDEANIDSKAEGVSVRESLNNLSAHNMTQVSTNYNATYIEMVNSNLIADDDKVDSENITRVDYWNSTFSVYAANGSVLDSGGNSVTFYVTNLEGSILYESGSLCGESTDSCALEGLEDGDYMWRVASYGHSNVTWDFCGVSGDATVELTFRIKDNMCTSLDTKSLSSFCFPETETDSVQTLSDDVAVQTVLHGSIRVTGVSSLAEDDTEAFRQALADEFNDANSVHTLAPHITVTPATMNGNRILLSGNRVQSALSFRVTLKNSIIQENTVVELRRYLQRSMSSSLFLARIHHLSSENGSGALRRVRSINLQRFSVEHVHVLNEAESKISSVVIFFGAIVGVICLYLLAVSMKQKGMKRDVHQEKIETKKVLHKYHPVPDIYEEAIYYTRC